MRPPSWASAILPYRHSKLCPVPLVGLFFWVVMMGGKGDFAHIRVLPPHRRSCRFRNPSLRSPPSAGLPRDRRLSALSERLPQPPSPRGADGKGPPKAPRVGDRGPSSQSSASGELGVSQQSVSSPRPPPPLLFFTMRPNKNYATTRRKICVDLFL